MSDTMPYLVVPVDDSNANEPVYELVGPNGLMRHTAVGRYKIDLDNDALILNEAYTAGWRAGGEAAAIADENFAVYSSDRTLSRILESSAARHRKMTPPAVQL